MNKLLNLIIILLCCATFPAFAQEYNLADSIPVDKNLRIGHLPNGLTYYIRNNHLPKDRVELRLVVNAGSILEDEDQQGLAHFTEHMCFNGTKHFAKNELVNYLQSVGVGFGADVNAYTSFDETVYQLFVPTDKAEVVENALLILEDWAHNVSFDPDQIDGERGVITEEWRLGRGAGQRLRDKFLPTVFYNSQYALRIPIGKIDIIKNFKPEQITRFYHDWYRPDLMSIIVVGDINPDQYEQMIKAHFGSIQNPKNERLRKVFDIPDHASTLYSIETDKEATQTQFIIYSKKNHKDQVTLNDYRDGLIESLYNNMLNQRFAELARAANPPFVMAHASAGSITRTKDSFTLSGRVADNTKVTTGLKAVLEEVERVKKFGFTESELERAKKSLLLIYQRQYDNRDKSESATYVGELVRNFLEKEAVPGIEFEYRFTTSQLPLITLKEVNDYDNSFQSDSNKVVVVVGPDKDGIALPTEDALKSIVAEVNSQKIEPHQDTNVVFTWKGPKPIPGTIVKEEKNAALGVTELTLSNGTNVLLKPTDFKNNQIFIVGYSKGGHSLCKDADYFSALYASVLVNESGIGGLSKTDLTKALAGKDVIVTPFLNNSSEGIKGKVSPQDLETFFQLANLYFTRPEIDSTVFETFITKQKANLATMQLDPSRYFEKQVVRFLSNNHPRGGGIPDVEDIDKINRQRAIEIFKERFANAGNFIFVIVGSFDMDKMKSMLETYIAGLPASPQRENARDLGIRPPKGAVSKAFYKGADPRSSVDLAFTGTAKFSEQEDFLLQALNDVLKIKFLETLREEKGGVYGISSNGYLSKFPYESYKEQISFDCAPENVDSLIAAAMKIVEDIKKNGIDSATLHKVIETKKHNLEVNKNTNAYWQSELLSAAIYGFKAESPEEVEAKIEKLNSKELQRVAKTYFNKNFARLVLYPQK